MFEQKWREGRFLPFWVFRPLVCQSPAWPEGCPGSGEGCKTWGPILALEHSNRKWLLLEAAAFGMSPTQGLGREGPAGLATARGGAAANDLRELGAWCRLMEVWNAWEWSGGSGTGVEVTLAHAEVFGSSGSSLTPLWEAYLRPGRETHSLHTIWNSQVVLGLPVSR